MIKPDDCTQVISKFMKMCFLMHYFVNKTKFFFRKLFKKKGFNAFWNFYFTNPHEVQTVHLYLLKLR